MLFSNATCAATDWSEERSESKYARALAVKSSEGKKVPPDPKKWKCAETGATENLWVNLSVGLALFTTLFCTKSTVQLMTASMIHPCNQSDTRE